MYLQECGYYNYCSHLPLLASFLQKSENSINLLAANTLYFDVLQNRINLHTADTLYLGHDSVVSTLLQIF
jgi:hypothetical protein